MPGNDWESERIVLVVGYEGKRAMVVLLTGTLAHYPIGAVVLLYPRYKAHRLRPL